MKRLIHHKLQDSQSKVCDEILYFIKFLTYLIEM